MVPVPSCPLENDQNEGVGLGRLGVTTARAGGGRGVTNSSWRLPHDDHTGLGDATELVHHETDAS